MRKRHLSFLVITAVLPASALLFDAKAQEDEPTALEKVKSVAKETKSMLNDEDKQLLKSKLAGSSLNMMDDIEKLRDPTISTEERKSRFQALSQQGMNLVNQVQTTEDLAELENELAQLGLSGESREHIKGVDTTQIYRAMADKYKELDASQLEAVRQKLVMETLRPLNEEAERLKALGLDEVWIEEQKNKISTRLIEDNNLGEEEFANQESYTQEPEIGENEHDNISSIFQLD